MAITRSLPRFSAELVFSALNTTLVRDSFAGNREFIIMDDETMLAAAPSDPPGLMALSTERPLTKHS